MERVTIQQASLRLNVSQKTIRESIRDGELKAFRQPGPRGDQWVVELPEEGWQDRHKKSYLELAASLPKWWWANEKNTGQVQRVAKNIAGLKVLGANSLNIIDVLKHQNLLMTEDSLEVLAKTYLK